MSKEELEHLLRTAQDLGRYRASYNILYERAERIVAAAKADDDLSPEWWGRLTTLLVGLHAPGEEVES